MMKEITLLLAAVCLVHATQVPSHIADKAFLIKQKNIYELFWHVDQPTIYHPELYHKARSFNLEDNIASFTDQTAVIEFLQRWKHGNVLPRGEIFTESHLQHYKEAICLFRVLYSAKDFDTFYNTAVWARFHVNEHMYVYVLGIVVMHRPDTKNIRLPPLYEVVPHYFFNENVLHKAYRIAMGDSQSGLKKTVDAVDYYYIPSNYTGWYMTGDEVPEQETLSYFIEDVGLSAFYFMTNHDFPVWMNSSLYNMPQHIRGELYMFNLKQLLIRYYLEKLSNDMGEISYVDVTKPIAVGYHSMMHHHNGLPFPQRPNGFQVPLHAHKYVQTIQDIHTRISDAIDKGYIVVHDKHIDIYNTIDGFNHLGNMIQGNADSVNPAYYGRLEYFYKKALSMSSFQVAKHMTLPSVIELFTTSLRDPVIYGIYKNIVTYWLKYKEHLPSYTHEQLVFPGVIIESVNIDNLLTFFDHFESLVSNAVSVRSHKEAQSMLIKTRQYRLNHKPFTYYITVNSNKNNKAVVRIFLGPKYDVHGHELDISENYMNFIEIDQWNVDLKSGTNKIERNSYESIYTVPDEMPSEVFYKKVVKAIEGSETFTYPDQLYGFPDRLILPKGKKEGMPFKLFVCISHFDETKGIKIDSPVWGPSVMDSRPLGYPLDRPIHNSFNFTIPNFYMRDVLIYHKQEEELNLTI